MPFINLGPVSGGEGGGGDGGSGVPDAAGWDDTSAPWTDVDVSDSERVPDPVSFQALHDVDGNIVWADPEDDPEYFTSAYMYVNPGLTMEPGKRYQVQVFYTSPGDDSMPARFPENNQPKSEVVAYSQLPGPSEAAYDESGWWTTGLAVLEDSPGENSSCVLVGPGVVNGDRAEEDGETAVLLEFGLRSEIVITGIRYREVPSVNQSFRDYPGANASPGYLDFAGDYGPEVTNKDNVAPITVAQDIDPATGGWRSHGWGNNTGVVGGNEPRYLRFDGSRGLTTVTSRGLQAEIDASGVPSDFDLDVDAWPRYVNLKPLQANSGDNDNPDANGYLFTAYEDASYPEEVEVDLAFPTTFSLSEPGAYWLSIAISLNNGWKSFLPAQGPFLLKAFASAPRCETYAEGYWQVSDDDIRYNGGLSGAIGFTLPPLLVRAPVFANPSITNYVVGGVVCFDAVTGDILPRVAGGLSDLYDLLDIQVTIYRFGKGE